MQVVDTTRPFEGGYMALSSFGFGGANMHMVFSAKGGQRINLLQSDSSSSDGSVSEEAQPEIVTPLAARSSEGLAYLANIVNEVLHSRLLGDLYCSLFCNQSLDIICWNNGAFNAKAEGY